MVSVGLAGLYVTHRRDFLFLRKTICANDVATVKDGIVGKRFDVFKNLSTLSKQNHVTSSLFH